MAQRDPNVEYVVKQTQGGTVTTLDIVLYAPDGSVFRMPHGGSPTTYIAKGMKLHPDAIWQAANDVHESEKAKSLKRSDFQREITNRKVEVARKIREKQMDDEMQILDDEMKALESSLDNPTPDPASPAVATKPAKAKPGKSKGK